MLQEIDKILHSCIDFDNKYISNNYTFSFMNCICMALLFLVEQINISDLKKRLKECNSFHIIIHSVSIQRVSTEIIKLFKT